MREDLIVNEWMTLDGVIQHPCTPMKTARTDSNSAAGTLGTSTTSRRSVLATIAQAGAFLFGRRTYESFAAHWPNTSRKKRGLSLEPLNIRPKYVASTTLAEPLAWRNSTLLHGDVPGAVLALKESEGDDLNVIGSARSSVHLSSTTSLTSIA